jgi:hypothetical protein
MPYMTPKLTSGNPSLFGCHLLSGTSKIRLAVNLCTSIPASNALSGRIVGHMGQHHQLYWE